MPGKPFSATPITGEEKNTYENIKDVAAGMYKNAELALLRADGGEALICIISTSQDENNETQYSITPLAKLLTQDEMKALRLHGEPTGGEF